MTLSKRGVQICLGLLWLLDGLLQLQPKMFTKQFPNQVLYPVAQGEPGFVSGPIHLGIHIFMLQPVLFNSLFALTQLLIGGLILYKRSVKWGLRLSVAWGIVVWILGEAYGGIFSGHTLLLMGAPGAALIYIVLSLAVMPTKDEAAKHSEIAYWLVIVWAVLWVGGGIYQLLPGQNTTGEISSMLSMNATSAPKWLAQVDNNSAKVIRHVGGTTSRPETAKEMNMTTTQMNSMPTPAPVVSTPNPGYWLIILFSLIQISIGALALLSGTSRKIVIWLGILLSLFFWIAGQDIGGLYSGLATDPSTGPLFVLMGLSILSQNNISKRLSQVGRSIRHLLIGAR